MFKSIWHVTALDDWQKKPFIDEDTNANLDEIMQRVIAETPNALSELHITFVRTED